MISQLTKKSVWLMLLLTIITYGIYIPFWFLNRKDAFNQLNSQQKISGGLIVSFLVLFIISAVLLIPSVLYMDTPIGKTVDDIDSIINLTGGIISIILSYHVRRILMEHYKVEISSIGTFFFGPLYIQHKINKLPNV